VDGGLVNRHIGARDASGTPLNSLSGSMIAGVLVVPRRSFVPARWSLLRRRTILWNGANRAGQCGVGDGFDG
jgi:hypothetical protein